MPSVTPRSGPPLSTGGWHPLVGRGQDQAFWAAKLAARGYIMAAVDKVGPLDILS